MLPEYLRTKQFIRFDKNVKKSPYVWPCLIVDHSLKTLFTILSGCLFSQLKGALRPAQSAFQLEVELVEYTAAL